jgi:hypothetical protein
MPGQGALTVGAAVGARAQCAAAGKISAGQPAQVLADQPEHHSVLLAWPQPGPHPRTSRRGDYERGGDRTHDRILSSGHDNHPGASTPLGLPITTDARKADRQTPAGAEALVIGAPGDPDAVGRALEKELAQVGGTNCP